MKTYIATARETDTGKTRKMHYMDHSLLAATKEAHAYFVGRLRGWELESVVLKKPKPETLQTELQKRLAGVFLGEKIPLDFTNVKTGEVLVPAYRRITKRHLATLASLADSVEVAPSPVRNIFRGIVSEVSAKWGKA